MKIKSLLSISATLMALSFTSSAEPIDVNQVLFNQPASNGILIEEVVFDWEGECADCQGARGVDNGNYDPVTGNITLKNVIQDENGVINFDSSNIFSIQYDGPSHHVQPFILFNADYDDQDDWRDNSTEFLNNGHDQNHVHRNFAAGYDDGPLIQPAHSEFSESISGSGWVNLNSSAYDATIAFDTLLPVISKLDESEFTTFEYVNLFGPYAPDWYYVREVAFTFDAISDGNWSMEVDGAIFDFGSGMQITSSTQTLGQTEPVTQQDPNAVSEPSTLAIFGLALAGLARLGRRKAA